MAIEICFLRAFSILKSIVETIIWYPNNNLVYDKYLKKFSKAIKHKFNNNSTIQCYKNAEVASVYRNTASHGCFVKLP